MSNPQVTNQDAGLDPEIPALIGVPAAEEDSAGAAAGATHSDEKSGLHVESTAEQFAPVDRFEDEPSATFDAKDYYKQALAGAGDIAAKLHQALTAFLTVKDPKERSLHRERMTTAFWALLGILAGRIARDMPQPKRMVLRFGALSPTLLSKEHRDMLSRVVYEQRYREPVYYVDEWLQLIAEG